eukprot:TRINITY_DN2469_c0_g1_i1.p1 TRINITY_DN2469_c0_g1~~TRINITY_DN2469_c0_g1_i1.p1  ORF type:complete len:852 (-),score=170.24 TRINITY_DN2469_c0_g1_i1:17-2521(-)
MEVPWSASNGSVGAADVAPPWVQHSKLQTQQELCAKRYLRLVSSNQFSGAVTLCALAFWQAGVHGSIAFLPIVYIVGPALCLQDLQRRAREQLGQLSTFILLLDCINALHLVLLCLFQGHIILDNSLIALFPLLRVVFGIFTCEIHCHLALSTVVFAVVAACSDTWTTAIAALLLELTAVVTLAEGPSGYEEAVLYLNQWRLQHQLMRSQAMQQMDLERERFSGELLSSATQSIAELTTAVQHAAEPVLCMLKSSCATGTKSAREAERIGRMGEALKDEVAQLMRYKTQAAKAKLQERAKVRALELREYAASQEASSRAALEAVRQLAGQSLWQMHELELEAESSLEQLVQVEVNRALETADARMDLVHQSAQAMEMRTSETVEVLLSLLKYFRSKSGASSGMVSVPQINGPTTASARQAVSSRSAPPRRAMDRKALPAIREGGSFTAASASSLAQDGFGDQTDQSEESAGSSSKPEAALSYGNVSMLLRDASSEDGADTLSTASDGHESSLLRSSSSGGDISHGHGHSTSSDTDAASEDTEAICDEDIEDKHVLKPSKLMLGATAADGATRPNSSASSDISVDATEDYGSESGHDESSSYRSVSTPVASAPPTPASVQKPLCSDHKKPKVDSGAARTSRAATRANSSASSDISMDATEDYGSESGHEESSSCRSVPTPAVSVPPTPASVQKPLDTEQKTPKVASGAPPTSSAGRYQGVMERHPLFATRLCYQTENFCWSWASARDFRSELDALRVWHRASVAQQPAPETTTAPQPSPPPGERAVPVPPPPPPSIAKVAERTSLLPSEIVVDLSAVSKETLAAARAAWQHGHGL